MDTSKTGTGRRRLTSKQRQRLLAKFHQSQFAQRELANRHAIGMSTLSQWLRLERNAIPAKVKFQEVRLPTGQYSTRQTATRCLAHANPAT